MNTRDIDHGHGHIDTETLINGIWAVTKCNQELTMSGYNGLNRIKIDVTQAGICPVCGRRLSNSLCTHATPEQVEYTKRLDAETETQTQARRERILKALSDKEGTAPSPIISGGEIVEEKERAETQDIITWLEDDPDNIPF